MRQPPRSTPEIICKMRKSPGFAVKSLTFLGKLHHRNKKKRNTCKNYGRKTNNDFYNKVLGFKPKIAVTGLNPHCETFAGKNIEKTEILPAIDVLKKKKIKISSCSKTT